MNEAHIYSLLLTGALLFCISALLFCFYGIFDSFRRERAERKMNEAISKLPESTILKIYGIKEE